VHLGKKFIQLDFWKEYRLNQTTIKLQKELENKNETLANLQRILQEHREVCPPSISIAQDNTMNKTTLLISHSFEFSQQHFGEFEKHTRGIG
jgi:hypothetical protein